MKKYKLLIAALLLAAGSSTLNAGIILTPNVGNLRASIFTDLTSFAFYDVRGAVGGVLGPYEVFIADASNGTDPNFSVLVFGNLTNSAFTADLLNIATLTFTSVGSVINGSVLTLPLSGASVANSYGAVLPLTTGPLTADFLFAGQQDLGGGQFIFQYDLQSISDAGAVPEPTTVALIGAGLPLLLFLRRRKAA